MKLQELLWFKQFKYFFAFSAKRVHLQYWNGYDDGDANKNGKKAKGLRSKTTPQHVHHAFLYTSLPSLHNYGLELPNFTFWGGREHKTTTLSFFSWTFIKSFRIQLQKYANI